jgi:hypothetical protein
MFIVRMLFVCKMIANNKPGRDFGRSTHLTNSYRGIYGQAAFATSNWKMCDGADYTSSFKAMI